MAKKKKNEDELQGLDEMEQPKKEGGNRVLTILITLLIIIIWLAVFALLIKFDAGGFGSNVLRPILKDVPVINKILPSVSEEQLAEENDYPYKNLPDAIDRIRELEAEVEDLKKNGASSSKEVAELEGEVERLKVFEENQKEFEQRVTEFEENVVFNDSAPGIDEYRKYYEDINPNNAEEIYRQVVEQQQYDKKVEEQGQMYAAMDPEEAAPILEVLAEGDVELVGKILSTMRTNQSGPILAAMDSVKAARISKKMSVK